MRILPYIFTGFIVLLSLLIQGHSSFDVLRIGGVKPDLFFIAVVYFSYTFGSFYGEVTAFAGGLICDAALSDAPLGFLTLPKVIIAYVIGLFGRAVFRQTLVSVFIILFAASLVKGLLTLFLNFMFFDDTFRSVVSVIIPEAFYNAILAPFLFKIFDILFASEIERSGY